ncbi:hypothetical protein NQ314_013259 [Rhamnusium bicolor]|uniref:Uncharacterized protein n=1 Tax=Rhamnusium bicolor TaxID=1586634 RepID=A0AAV8X874_9CUCU|nr:hypothetical protein NQ314_013259 [Rhamnusium bicolor]
MITDEIFQLFVNETNVYAQQEKNKKNYYKTIPNSELERHYSRRNGKIYWLSYVDGITATSINP